MGYSLLLLLWLNFDNGDAENEVFGVGISWMLENWPFNLGALGSFLLCRRACLCKILSPFI